MGAFVGTFVEKMGERPGFFSKGYLFFGRNPYVVSSIFYNFVPNAKKKSK